jgi:hypothetical protein
LTIQGFQKENRRNWSCRSFHADIGIGIEAQDQEWCMMFPNSTEFEQRMKLFNDYAGAHP